MPKVDGKPEALRAFLYHGLDLTWTDGGSQAHGDCPLCGKAGKFSVSLETSKWDCKSCAASGNAQTFLRHLHEASLTNTSQQDYEALAQERGLLDRETPASWGAVKSIITDEWLVPGYAPAGPLVQLYRYAPDIQGRRRLMATPKGAGVPGHGLFGVPLLEDKANLIYLCEGPWDGMALWEALRHAKRGHEDGPLEYTGNAAASLLGHASVLAVPSCNVFVEGWAAALAGREAVLLYDSDHPRPHPKTGVLGEPAGYEGTRRVAEVLAVAEMPPAKLSYLKWGPGGYDAQKETGWDVRDELTAGGPGPGKRVRALAGLLAKVEPIPEAWVSGRSKDAKEKGKLELEELPCSTWKELENAWRRAFQWTSGHSKALSCMLAVATSTEAAGDQLWMRVVGPPASGKSVLCEALSVCKKFVLANSTMRGFHSGYKADSDGQEDVSLLAKARNKTLVTKDGDTLLQAPNLGQILSEARDVYDRVSRTHYRNKMARTYEGHNMTWLLCGTESLRSLDKSELGERMLDCIMIDDMSSEDEDEIGLRIAYRADQDVMLLSNGKGQDSPEITKAKRLTGGYVSFLRKNAQRLLASVRASDASLRQCQRLAKFVSILRARPSVKQEEKAQRELSFRLVSQLVRLAKCLAVVMNCKTLDEEIMRRVRAVALDTARGRMLEIFAVLHEHGKAGVETKGIALLTGESEEKQRTRLRFLRDIGAVESFVVQITRGYRSKPRWRLTAATRDLYNEVMGLPLGAGANGKAKAPGNHSPGTEDE